MYRFLLRYSGNLSVSCFIWFWLLLFPVCQWWLFCISLNKSVESPVEIVTSQEPYFRNLSVLFFWFLSCCVFLASPSFVALILSSSMHIVLALECLSAGLISSFVLCGFSSALCGFSFALCGFSFAFFYSGFKLPVYFSCKKFPYFSCKKFPYFSCKKFAVIIDRNLTFNSHVQAFGEKISKQVCQLAKIKNSFLRHSIHFTYIYIFVISPVWDGCSHSPIKRLSSLQKRYLGLINSKQKCDRSNLYRRLNILPLHKRLLLNKAKLTSSSYLWSLFKCKSDNIKCLTMLHIPRQGYTYTNQV